MEGSDGSVFKLKSVIKSIHITYSYKIILNGPTHRNTCIFPFEPTEILFFTGSIYTVMPGRSL